MSSLSGIYSAPLLGVPTVWLGSNWLMSVIQRQSMDLAKSITSATSAQLTPWRC